MLIDLGAGDRTPDTTAFAWLTNSAGAARVVGDVTFRGGAGTETVGLRTDGDGATLDVGGSLRAVGTTVAAPVEDELFVGRAARVRGDVNTVRYTYTTVFGTVDGDARGDSADSPGGMGFGVFGTVHGDVRATGGATAEGYFSYARIGGRVDGDVSITSTAGWAVASVTGLVGGDVRVSLADHAVPGRANAVTLYGEVGGDVSIRSARRFLMSSSALLHGDLSVTATGPSASLFEASLVEGDLRFTGGSRTNSSVVLGSPVRGSAVIDLGGSAGNTASLTVQDAEFGGRIEGSLTVRGRAGATSVRVGYVETFEIEFEPGVTETFTYQTAGVIGGDLTLDLGDGANTFEFNGAVGSTLGRKLTYRGGSGADRVTISGANTFAADIRTGAGDDTVDLAPDASLGSLTLDLGTGNDTWTPPATVGFPLTVKRR